MTQLCTALRLMGLPLLVGILVLMGNFVLASAADAALFEPAATSTIIPVKAAKASPVCKAVVACAGCKPVYRCRVCRKRPICTHGVCIYRPTCGWGPALNALPKGTRVIKVR